MDTPEIIVSATGDDIKVVVQEPSPIESGEGQVSVHVAEPVTVVEIIDNGNTVQVAGYVNIFGGGGSGGLLYITDIVPSSVSDNVGNKVFSEDGNVLLSCSTTSLDVVAHVLAMSGPSAFRPSIEALGNIVPLAPEGSTGFWVGSVAVTLEGPGFLRVDHGDGSYWQTEISLDIAPTIISAQFEGSYPGTQTELKENDSFSYSVVADQPFVFLEIENYGAYKAAVIDIAEAGSYNNSALIANRGNVPQNLPFRVRVKSASGSYSPWFTSTNTVTLNNAKPVISIGSTAYPSGQQALKNDETATINVSITGFDSAEYISSELEVTLPLSYEQHKLVKRVGGTYNVSSNNLTVRARKDSNNSESVANLLVKIANVAPVVSVATSATRLRSGIVAQNYTVNLSSNQHLLSAPSLSAPTGTLIGSWSGSGSLWQRTISIDDSDSKGTFTWQNVIAIGLSGLQAVDPNSSYVIGGFTRRTITIPAWPFRSQSIGTFVSDVSKLRCSNLSKGPSGSFNFAYQATTEEAANKFTVIDGNVWYNCDGLNASSNTTGSMLVEIEELT